LQFFGKEGSELDVPLAERLVAHVDATLLEQFLDVTVTLAQKEVMVEPKRVLDDARRKTVSVRSAVNPRYSAYYR